MTRRSISCSAHCERRSISFNTGARTGLVFVDAAGHRRDYSFAEIAAQSQQYAAVLRAFGVERGERVALCISNTAKCLFTLLALERLGAVCILCAEAWSDARTLERLQRTGASTVIANRKRRAALDALREQLPQLARSVLIGEECEGWARLDALASRAQPYAGIEPSENDEAFITEERSFTYVQAREAAAQASANLQLVQTDRFWCTLPMGERGWIEYVLLAAWWGGACLIVHEAPFGAEERLELLRELEVSVVLASAAEYEAQSILPAFASFRAPRLRRCLSLGEVSAAAAQRWSEVTGAPLTSYEAV